MLYFSATGNSKYVAKLFSKNTNATCHSIEENINFTQLLASSKTIGFCYPVYGSRVPKIMHDFVRTHLFSLKDKKIIIFCTQMYFSGDGARALIDLFPRDYVKIIYAEHFLMPNNVCNLFFMPLASKKWTDKYMAHTQRKMKIVCAHIKNGIIKKRGFNPASQALGLIQGAFFPFLEKWAKKRVWIDSDCNHCQLCLSVCPVKNFANENDKIITKNNCMMCYRCINKCPQKAIAVSLRVKVKKQYKGV